ncbi:uncharacterized protein [Misgurnus anguillicaudatus]|uniref:uncharacterized protein n=1 Tax=Misgurnus anguillicaudatus TaxID=75329 RepID=UPI003CCF5035
MPRKGKRSQAQKMRRGKVDLDFTRLSRTNKVEQPSISTAVAQVSGRLHVEDCDSAPRVLSVQASHCQGDISCRKNFETIAVLSNNGYEKRQVRMSEKIKCATTPIMTSWVHWKAGFLLDNTED